MSRDLLYPRRVRWSEQELRHLLEPPTPTTTYPGIVILTGEKQL